MLSPRLIKLIKFISPSETKCIQSHTFFYFANFTFVWAKYLFLRNNYQLNAFSTNTTLSHIFWTFITERNLTILKLQEKEVILILYKFSLLFNLTIQFIGKRESPPPELFLIAKHCKVYVAW